MLIIMLVLYADLGALPSLHICTRWQQQQCPTFQLQCQDPMFHHKGLQM